MILNRMWIYHSNYIETIGNRPFVFIDHYIQIVTNWLIISLASFYLDLKVLDAVRWNFLYSTIIVEKRKFLSLEWLTFHQKWATKNFIYIYSNLQNFKCLIITIKLHVYKIPEGKYLRNSSTYFLISNILFVSNTSELLLRFHW
jgi:hypothetical protein